MDTEQASFGARAAVQVLSPTTKSPAWPPPTDTIAAAVVVPWPTLRTTKLRFGEAMPTIAPPQSAPSAGGSMSSVGGVST